MKYVVLNNYVQAIAESDSENLILISLSKSATPVVVSQSEEERKVEVRIIKAPKKSYRKSNPEKSRNLDIMREQIASIPAGGAGFITTDLAHWSRNFSGFVHNIANRSKPKLKASTHKVYGGYEVKMLAK